eukprot:scaffold447_cov307-Pinguiococcus_pyrenoidosus.AAC.34
MQITPSASCTGPAPCSSLAICASSTMPSTFCSSLSIRKNWMARFARASRASPGRSAGQGHEKPLQLVQDLLAYSQSVVPVPRAGVLLKKALDSHPKQRNIFEKGAILHPPDQTAADLHQPKQRVEREALRGADACGHGAYQAFVEALLLHEAELFVAGCGQGYCIRLALVLQRALQTGQGALVHFSAPERLDQVAQIVPGRHHLEWSNAMRSSSATFSASRLLGSASPRVGSSGAQLQCAGPWSSLYARHRRARHVAQS